LGEGIVFLFIRKIPDPFLCMEVTILRCCIIFWRKVVIRGIPITACKVTCPEHGDVHLCSVEIAVGFVVILFKGFFGYLGPCQRIVL